MSEFWTANRTGNLTSAGVIAALSFFTCMYAIKYELSVLGVSTDRRGFHFIPLYLWRAIRRVEDGPKARLLWWGIMMWIFSIMMFVLVPFVVYVTYLSLFR